MPETPALTTSPSIAKVGPRLYAFPSEVRRLEASLMCRYTKTIDHCLRGKYLSPATPPWSFGLRLGYGRAHW